ncbi:hypothetical protein HGRIS_011430 [Hohenbuehelia grisea]|uniref:BTB domain-containing protein n=1 Tax=Hohenbuehelia grisea TaxID=104357 RepID=A0ABR3JVW2_9AGAR
MSQPTSNRATRIRNHSIASSQRLGRVAKRDTQLYYADGNVVLRAEGPVDESDHSEMEVTYFRVHRYVLASHSPVFAAMFSLPAGVKPELYDDAHLICVDDDANELRSLLRVFYDPYFVPSERYSQKYPSLMLGPLKLANRYEIDPLREQIIARVRAAWPTTLSAWDKRHDELYANVCNGPICPEDAIKLVIDGGIEDQVPHELAMMFYELNTILLREAHEVDPEYLRVLFFANRAFERGISQAGQPNNNWPELNIHCQKPPTQIYACRQVQTEFYPKLAASDCKLYFLRDVIESLAPMSGVQHHRVFERPMCLACASKLLVHCQALREMYIKSIPQMFQDVEPSN